MVGGSRGRDYCCWWKRDVKDEGRGKSAGDADKNGLLDGSMVGKGDEEGEEVELREGK